jgi:hypothetical protein
LVLITQTRGLLVDGHPFDQALTDACSYHNFHQLRLNLLADATVDVTEVVEAITEDALTDEVKP